jgi:mannose-6-phosphate isomerase-like protein (cupin superfamily)
MAATQPVNLTAALASFDQVYSPRIVTRMNDYDVRVAHVAGEHVWHTHSDTDEFFLVIEGEFHITLRDGSVRDEPGRDEPGRDEPGRDEPGRDGSAADGPAGDGAERTVVLRAGDTFVVPKGTPHKPSSPGGSILMFEPSGTSTTGDSHEGEIPAYVDSTVGHQLR